MCLALGVYRSFAWSVGGTSTPHGAQIPAAFAYANGVWFKVKQGLRGLVVRTRAGEPVAYMVCEPATRYYRVMTRCEWMPVFIGEVI